MRAVRLKSLTPTPGARQEGTEGREASHQYSDKNPAPASAIEIRHDVPVPQPTRSGQMVVQVKATSVIRDNLTWPELYSAPGATTGVAQLGNDFSGVVVAVYGTPSVATSGSHAGEHLNNQILMETCGRVSSEQEFHVGDEVYGMASADRGGAWAEYLLVNKDEVWHKPAALSWEEAAAVPLSAMTADQALFEHAKLHADRSDRIGGAQQGKRVLITGAAGGVGTFLVQFAAQAGCHVVAASSSNERNGQFLRSLGAEEVIEYVKFREFSDVDVVIDTVGGDVLRQTWGVIKSDGTLVSIDSASWNFVREHDKQEFTTGKKNVQAVFFIVEPSKKSMARVSETLSKGNFSIFVAKVMTLQDAREAYELGCSKNAGRGKVILVP